MASRHASHSDSNLLNRPRLGRMTRFPAHPVCGTKSHLYSQFVLKSSQYWACVVSASTLISTLMRWYRSDRAPQMRDEGYKMWRRVSRWYQDVVWCGRSDSSLGSPDRTLNATAMEVGRAGYAGHRRLGVRLDAPQLRGCLLRFSQQPDCGPGTTRVSVDSFSSVPP